VIQVTGLRGLPVLRHVEIQHVAQGVLGMRMIGPTHAVEGRGNAECEKIRRDVVALLQ
jgi:hypothetical protein